MYSCEDVNILNHIADYRVNLIAPDDLADNEREQFHSNLREVMLYIKYSKNTQKLRKMVATDEHFKNVERQAADVINAVTQSKLKYPEGKESIDMCLAIDQMRSESEIKGAIMAYKMLGMSLSDIIKNISKQFNLSENDSDETVRKYWE